MAEGKDGHDLLALELVDIALDDDQSISQDASEEAAQLRRLDKVVWLMNQDLGQSPRIGQYQTWLVEEPFEGYQAIIGYLVHPFQKVLAWRLFEERKTISKEREAALSKMLALHEGEKKQCSLPWLDAEDVEED
jgi:hypothetical protein